MGIKEGLTAVVETGKREKCELRLDVARAQVLESLTKQFGLCVVDRLEYSVKDLTSDWGNGTRRDFEKEREKRDLP